MPPLTAENLPKIGKKREKSGKKRKNREENANMHREGSFTLPLLKDRAGYATVRGRDFRNGGWGR